MNPFDVDEKYETKSKYMRDNAKDRTHNYLKQTKDMLLPEDSKDNKNMKKKKEGVLEEFKRMLKKNDFHKDYFDKNADGKERLCNHDGKFVCQGSYIKGGCNNNNHHTNPYLTEENRKTFRSWNFNHWIQIGREVLPKLKEAVEKTPPGKMSLKIRLRSLNRKVPQLEDIEGQRTTGFSNAAAYMRRYRGRIKADQECYVQYRAKETERVKEYRQTMSQEAKERTNETARLRMKKYRERKRLENIHEKVNAKSDRSMQTRSEKEKKSNQREKWRLYKQRYRAGLNSQKRRRIREKDAAAKRNKAHKRQLDNPEPPASTNTENVGNSTFPSPNARRKAISRARLSIPKTREKYAEVVAALVNKASPRKKDLLAKQGIGSPNAADQSNVLAAIQKTCGSLGKRQKRTFTMHLVSSLKDSKYGLKRRTSQYLGLRWKYLMKYSSLAKKNVNIEAKKSRSDAISADITAAVAEHYERAEVSTQMPNKKNIGKANAAKHVLQKTVKKTYQSFLEENPNMSVSFSKFASLRPKHVLVQKYAQHFQCLCEYCTNIDLKIKVINLQLVRHKIGLRLNDRYHTKDITTCGRTGKFPMLSCIDRKCNICGVQKLAEFLQPLTDVMGEHELTWQIWGKTSFNGTMRKALLRRTGSYGDLLQELQDELHPFACHLFEAIWQQRQFWSVIRSPPTLSVVIVMDFAENFSCITQNEVQSAHWTKMMVTLHPMVGYYKCHADGCSQGTVREAIHIVSEDMIHDTHAVTHFCKLACTHLKVERKVEFNRLIQFTDGCGAQYKSRTGFADISFGNIDFGVQVERHFFGSRHGKNPCDGEGGVVKNAVTRSVKSDVNVTIDGPREFYDFCSKNLAKAPVKPDGSCNHSRRTFYLVKEGDIQRERPTRTNVDTVAGTRKLHAVAGISHTYCTKGVFHASVHPVRI
ncbi:hypothetical protein BSL78_09645 [Apostichopus japonicus]|uniref:DNA fragmentation factor 40 C-terminal domain-containing protein n=1 Tax=Stichopus japonicus TaxID=307972 RepID=A0A2G8KZM2_STIJA|nr:hypothetical protein BSL78_09645 [Apostichopus japonicus]